MQEQRSRERSEAMPVHDVPALDLHRLMHRSMLMDLATDILLVLDSDGFVVDANQATVDIHGGTIEQLIGSNVIEHVHPSSYDDFAAFADLVGPDPRTLQRRMRCYRGDRSTMTLDIKASWSPETQYFYLVERDVSAEVARAAELDELARQLALQAHTDALTGLHNRAAYEDRVCMPSTSANHQWMVVIDIDYFKRVNDGYGHSAGDAVLRSVADRLTRELDSGDFAARIGGDEFVAILRDRNDAAGVCSSVGELHRVLSEPHLVNGVEIAATCSLGVAEALPGDTGDDWYRRADQAMYARKRQGRDGVTIER